MKYVYYGFGAFIGFICGVIINLIFYWVEKAGYHIMRDLVENFGFIGKHIGTLINILPFIGAGLGIIMVRLLFQKELEDKKE